MRTAFVTTLTKLARENKDIILITGDLGFTVFETFKQEFPDQFINIGVSEQNMISVAAGMALSGKIVYAYSIAPFATLRCYEQIRNDVCFHNANVKIVGVGGGFSYGVMGPSHHALEDIAVMKALPNMKIICPADHLEVEAATLSISQEVGPFYLRLGKKGEKNIHRTIQNFKIGKAITVRKGKDITIIATGNMLEAAIEVANLLASQYLEVQVLSVHTVKPLDNEAILNAAAETKAIFTIEEHFYEGGLGASVAEVLSEQKHTCLFKRFAVKNEVFKICGTQEYLRELNGLTVPQIEQKIKESLK